ncbi:MAG: CPBP family intramembrane metalloprotease [Clostridiales bacterium]|nr:CPBP family intramembrane metalloprotease [Clostridiales bacterium]
MEDKALRKGLSVTAILLIAVLALLVSFNSANGIVYGDQAALYGIPFIAAFAIPLLTVLIVLARYCTSTDTVEEMMAAIAVRYAIWGWCFIFLIKFASAALELICPEFYDAHFTTIYLLMNSFNVSVVGCLVLGLSLKTLPSVKIEKRSLKFGQILTLILMVYGLAQVGSLMGMPIHTALTSVTYFSDTSTEDALSTLKDSLILNSDTFIRILTVGIMPAIFEELLFRKFLIDRTLRHGEFVSCAMSGIMFGLWHGNFQQFFFAFFLGVLFSFVYIRTGRIIYTMILHASLNLVTSSVTVELLAELLKRMGLDMNKGTIDPNIDYDAVMKSIMPLMLLLLLWLIVLLGLQIAGFVLVIVKRKNFKLMQIVGELPRKEILRKLTHNVTMWVFFALALLLFVNTYLPDILAFIFRR